MADQTTLKGSSGFSANAAGASGPGSNGADCGPTRSPRGNPVDSGPSGVVHNVTGFGEDLLTLAELQARLTAIELRQNLDFAKGGGAILMAGVLLAVSSMPVLIAGVAEVLVSELEMNRGAALLSVGLATMAIAGLCIGVGRHWLRKKLIWLSAGQRGIHAERELGANRSASKWSVAQASVRFYGLAGGHRLTVSSRLEGVMIDGIVTSVTSQIFAADLVQSG